MGNTSAIARKEDDVDYLGPETAMVSDLVFHRNHMEAYECGEEFSMALEQCNPEYLDGAARDDDACAKATAALRRCMEADPMHFRAYVRAMDKGLDEDERRALDGKPPLSAWDYDDGRFRWWSGMKRT